MDATGWTLIIGAFFSGLTGLLVATIPLILQMRSNQKSIRTNTVAAAANTVALNHVSRESITPDVELGRLRAAVMPLLDPEAIDDEAVVGDVRRSLLAVLGRRDFDAGSGRSIVQHETEEVLMEAGVLPREPEWSSEDPTRPHRER